MPPRTAQRQVLLLVLAFLGLLNFLRLANIYQPQTNYDIVAPSTASFACHSQSSEQAALSDRDNNGGASNRISTDISSSTSSTTTSSSTSSNTSSRQPEEEKLKRDYGDTPLHVSVIRPSTQQYNQTLLQLQQAEESKVKLQQIQKSLKKSQERVKNLKEQLSKADVTQVLQIAIRTGAPVEDDGLQYKSCRRVESEWQCRDCGEQQQNSSSWTNCELLQPQSPCQSWKVDDWDHPRPRRQTVHDDFALEDGLRYAVKRPGYRGELEQFPCLQLQDCFNLSRCEGMMTKDGGGVLQVYTYGELDVRISQLMVAGRLDGVINLTSSPYEACLLVVTPRSFPNKRKEDFKNLTVSNYWNEGRNHFLFRSQWILLYDWDRFSAKEHSYHRAALSTPNFYQGNVRVGYDMPLYYDHPQKPFSVNDTIYELVTSDTTIHRPRSVLLAFQGTIKRSPWFQHRWLASAYWPQQQTNGTDDNATTDILINVRCPLDGVEMTQAGEMDYVTALTSSTFAFCPGGMSPGSWRFGEALAMGAIPIVTTDFLAPFYPELQQAWSRCLIRVNEGRIIDLPRIVRMIPEDEVRRRQVACHELFVGTIGWMQYKSKWTIDIDGATFLTAMRVWKGRIAAEMRKRQTNLVFELHTAAETPSSRR